MGVLSPSFTAQSSKPGAARLVLALCLALPWLNGFTAGPTPNFWPLWGSAVLGVAVLLQWRKLDAQCVAQAWLAAALLSSGMALLQYFGLAAEWAPWVSRSEVGQSYANLRQRNQFASLTSIGLVCLLTLHAGAPGPAAVPSVTSNSTRSSWLRRSGSWGGTGAAAAAALLALGNAASSSRTGFLQWTLIVAVLGGAWLAQAWQQGRRQGRRQGEPQCSPKSQRLTTAALALWAMACYAASSLLLPAGLLAWQQVEIGSLAERLAGAGQDSRRVLWSNVLHLIAQKPWSGWGWGELDFAHFITAYPGARFAELLDHAHNLPLHLAVELGVPFASLTGLAGAAWVWRSKPWQEREAGRLLAWGVLGVIGVHSLLEYPLWYGPFQWAAVFCALWLWRTRAGVGLGAGGLMRAGPAAHFALRPWLLAVLCWAALAVLALDYARVSQLYLPVPQRWSGFQKQPWAALDKLGGSVFFKDEIGFARLVTTPVTEQNATQMHALALDLLHYSPEPRVVEPLIASAILLGHHDTARFYLRRYRAAFSSQAWAQLLERHPAWAVHLPS